MTLNQAGLTGKDEYFFWPYDSPPYVLGGVGQKAKEPFGKVAYVPSYQGHFNYVACFPVETGKKLDAELEEAADEHALAKQEAHKAMMAKIRSIKLKYGFDQ